MHLSPKAAAPGAILGLDLFTSNVPDLSSSSGSCFFFCVLVGPGVAPTVSETSEHTRVMVFTV